MNISISKNCLSSPWLALSLIALTATIIYSNIYHCPFVFDDIPKIREGEAIRDLSNYLSLKKLLKPRAIVNFTFALNYRFGKLNVFGYHLVNVLIHIINGFIVYFLSLMIFTQLSALPDKRKVKKKNKKGKMPEGISQSSIFNLQSSIPMMSLIAALIFVAHPIQTQAVTYIIQRYASIAAMFYMGSVLFYLKARMIQKSAKYKVNDAITSEQTGQVSNIPFTFHLSLFTFYLLAILCAILALLSKQNTASLPGAILLVEYLLIDRTWQGWKKKIPWFILILLLLVFLVLYVSGFFTTREVQFSVLLEDISDRMRATTGVNRWSYLCTQFNVLSIYIRLLFLPLGQNLDYYYPFKSGFFDDYTPLAFLFLVSIAALGIWNRKKRPIITVAIFWFFITLSVESSIIPITDALFEHRLYLPMFGFALIVTYLIFNILLKQRSWAIIISFFIIVSLGIATYARNRVWGYSIELWSDVVSKSPKNERAHNNLANVLMDKGVLKDAINHFYEAVRLNPSYADAHNNLGAALVKQGNLKEAIRHYHEALQIKPKYAEAHYNLGNALTKLGRINEAIRHYHEAIRIKRRYADVYINLGIAVASLGRMKDAIGHFKKALRIKPDYAEGHYNLGRALAAQGNLQKAIDHFTEALRIKPEYAEAQNNLGVVLARMGRMKDAIGHFKKALRIKPDYAEGHYNVGRALAAQGNLKEAIDHFSEALRIKPDYMRARYNLERTLRRTRKSKDLSKSGVRP